MRILIQNSGESMKNIFMRTVLLFSFLSCAQPAWSSEGWEGMDIVRFCTGDTVLFDDAICRAYIQGIVDAHEHFQLQGKHPKSFCVPKEKARRDEGEGMVPKWLEAFKERLHQKPQRLVVDALHAIFPCP